MKTPAGYRSVSVTIGPDSVVVAAPNQVSSDLGGETVILELDRGVYFGLTGAGPRIWELLRDPRRVSEIRDAVVAEFEVETDRCQRDLLDLLARMVERGLVEVRDGSAG